MKILNEKGLITEEAKQLFLQIGQNTSCECPQHLVQILDVIQRFSKYQESCLKQSPQDDYIHEWLMGSSKNLEHIVSTMITNLARMEGYIDHNNEFIAKDEIRK